MRSNEFENKVEGIIKGLINPILPHNKKSLRAIEVLKQSDSQDRLFTDAGSPYPTPTGRQKQTEFVLWSPSNNIDWRIECKSRKTQGLIGEIVKELRYVKLIPEQLYCLVLNDILDDKYILDQITEEIELRDLTSKVWFGTDSEFKAMLVDVII